MNRVLAALIVSLSLAAAAQAFTVTGVSAHQRWPWNNLVDVDFTIGDANADAQFKIDVKAAYAGGDQMIVAKTFIAEPLANAGSNRVTWDFGKDFPNFKADDLRVAVTATPYDNSSAAIYMVIDLSGGKDATTYPVRYTTTPPAHVQGAANEPCQATELWLKRIKCGSFKFCSSDTVPDGYFRVNLTKDYYLGVFECTQQQWAQVTGAWTSSFSNETYRASRPVDFVSSAELCGYSTPSYVRFTTSPSTSSFIGKMRARTGLSTFSVPTRAQWEYASRCGYNGTRNPEYVVDSSHMRYGGTTTGMDYANADVSVGTAYVGSYDPSPWGLYEVLGNAWEFTMDFEEISATDLQAYYADLMDPKPDPVTAATVVVDDPHGTDKASYKRAYCGGGWTTAARNINHAAANHADNVKIGMRGVRFCVTCE